MLLANQRKYRVIPPFIILFFLTLTISSKAQFNSSNTTSKEPKENKIKEHHTKVEYERYKKKIAKDIKEGKPSDIKKDQKVLSKDRKMMKKQNLNRKQVRKSAKAKKGTKKGDKQTK